jgi:hypothetical protein
MTTIITPVPPIYYQYCNIPINYCNEHVSLVSHFICIPRRIAQHRKSHKQRLAEVKTIPGTRSTDTFVPGTTDVVRMYRLFEDVAHHFVFVVSDDLQEGVAIVCVVNGDWRFGIMRERDEDESEASVTLMKKKCYCNYYSIWTIHEETC